MAIGKKTGGRVKGTPNKATADVKEAARAYTVEAVERLAQIMRNSESDAAVVAAIREILDRGHGKASQPVEHSGGVTVDMEITDRERAKGLALLVQRQREEP